MSADEELSLTQVEPPLASLDSGKALQAMDQWLLPDITKVQLHQLQRYTAVSRGVSLNRVEDKKESLKGMAWNKQNKMMVIQSAN